jgi:DNA-binding NarL/FixJ family response regulator
METIRILIADNAFLVREGIKAVVSQKAHLAVVGEARNQRELRQKTQANLPDVVILDYQASNAFSPENVQEVLRLSPNTSILVISSNLQRTQVLKVLEYGALGFLLKECDETEILGAIKAVAKGEKFFCSKVLDILLERSIGSTNGDFDPCEPTRLTLREIEVVRQMAEGRSAQDIANHLELSVHTVYTHRKNIMRKLGASSASEIVKYAYQTALV